MSETGRLPQDQLKLIGSCAASLLTMLLGGCSRAPEAVPVPRHGAAIGINVDGLSYFGTEVAPLDLFKLSAMWFTQCDPDRDLRCHPGEFTDPLASSWDTREQGKLDLDLHGYPRSLPGSIGARPEATSFTSVATLVPTGLTSQNPVGRFLVLYNGEGSIEYGRGAAKNEVLSRPGRDVIDVTTDGAQPWFQLSIRATDPNANGRYLRNVRVLPAGGVCGGDRTAYCSNTSDSHACAAGSTCIDFEDVLAEQPFDPRFLANLQPFRAVRFMGFQNTNGALTESWAQRTLPERATWALEHGDGCPVEMMVAIGNRLGVDIWVNMPTLADDDYVRRFAMLVRRQLDRNRRVYVEYSNEAWNTAFAGGSWIERQGLARWPNAPDTPFGKRLQWFGMRTAQICDIWEQAWEGDADRIICVMGSQAANTWVAEQSLDCPLWASENGGIPCYRHHVDALAIAPYFGSYIGDPRHAAELQSWVGSPDGGLGRLFSEIFEGGQFPDSPAGGALAQASQEIQRNVAVARRRNLELVGYEGGQHLVARGAVQANAAIAALFVTANRDPRMADAYRVHLHDWAMAGGGLYNLWVSVGPYSSWGSWGLLEHRDQGSSPKYDAVKRFIAELETAGN